MKYRTFTSEDQIAFAKLSGDYNPLHIDALAARRLLFGSPVVHGIHALLWGLDCCLEDREEHVELRSIKVVFHKPIKVGEEVSVSPTHACAANGPTNADEGARECRAPDGRPGFIHGATVNENANDGHLSIDLTIGGSIVTKIEVELHKSVRRTFDYLETCLPKKLQPRVLLDDEIEADSGTLGLCLNVEAATKMFPHLMRCFSPLQIAVILSTTRLVGVVCPGLHSLYSEIELSTTTPNENTTLDYEVANFDSRFGLVLLKITAPDMTGIITAFRRPAPQEQANYLTLRHRVNGNEFAGQRALVIGGSRGLGEVAAKLLSGGGADVKITYYQGEEDARRIVDDIASNGGRADSFQLDVLNPRIGPPDVSANDWVPTHLYYFATPLISPGKSTFSPPLFSRFCDYYVTGLVRTLDQLSDLGVRYIFYPSTVFIDELPQNMGEYAAAKTAGETLCSFLEKANLDMRIWRPRLPRMATDQTVSTLPVTNQDPIPIMIQELRSFRDSSIGNG